METYRKIKHWQSHSRDMVESFKRYYHNSFLDSQRQEAYNLFLGNYIHTQGQPMLWDLSTDYYLHHSNPRSWSSKRRPRYIRWYTPENLENPTMPVGKIQPRTPKGKRGLNYDDYWLEYYRPVLVSSLLKIYAFNMESTARYSSEKSIITGHYNFSPFCTRKAITDMDAPEKKVVRKGVTIVAPDEDDVFSTADNSEKISRPSTAHADDAAYRHGILRSPHFEVNTPVEFSGGVVMASPRATDKNFIAQWTMNQIYYNSLHPTVTVAEAAEYEQYVSHPLSLPLVVSTELPDNLAANLDYVEYVNGVPSSLELGGSGGLGNTLRVSEVTEEDLADYKDFFDVAENPLTVSEEDGDRKRYKAYRKWLHGKSFFKQSKTDPEFHVGT